MKTIPLLPKSSKLFAMVDDADYPLVCDPGFKWKAVKNGVFTYVKGVVVRRGVSERKPAYVFLHRYLARAPRGLRVYPADGNGLDCQRANIAFGTGNEEAEVRRLYAQGLRTPALTEENQLLRYATKLRLTQDQMEWLRFVSHDSEESQSSYIRDLIEKDRVRMGCEPDASLAKFKGRYFGTYVPEEILVVFRGLLADQGLNPSDWFSMVMMQYIENEGLQIPSGECFPEYEGLNYIEEPYFENAKPIVGESEATSKHWEAFELLQDFLLENDGALCRETILECCAEHSVSSATAIRALAAGVKDGTFDRYQKGKRVYYYIGPLKMNPDGSPPVGMRPPKPTGK